MAWMLPSFAARLSNERGMVVSGLLEAKELGKLIPSSGTFSLSQAVKRQKVSTLSNTDRVRERTTSAL